MYPWAVRAGQGRAVATLFSSRGVKAEGVETETVGDGLGHAFGEDFFGVLNFLYEIFLFVEKGFFWMTKGVTEVREDTQIVAGREEYGVVGNV
jgi:hypothetical protein